MKRFMLMAIVICLVCVPAYSQLTIGSHSVPTISTEAPQPDGWTVTVAGSDDLISVRVGARPWLGRTELGGFGIWLDGLAEEEEEAYGGGVYATYDLVQDAQFTIGSYSVPATIYVGGTLGVVEREDSEADAVSALMTGLSFGDDQIRIGLEYQYLLDDGVWKEFGQVDEESRLLLTLSRRF